MLRMKVLGNQHWTFCIEVGCSELVRIRKSGVRRKYKVCVHSLTWSRLRTGHTVLWWKAIGQPYVCSIRARSPAHHRFCSVSPPPHTTSPVQVYHCKRELGLISEWCCVKWRRRSERIKPILAIANGGRQLMIKVKCLAVVVSPPDALQSKKKTANNTLYFCFWFFLFLQHLTQRGPPRPMLKTRLVQIRYIGRLKRRNSRLIKSTILVSWMLLLVFISCMNFTEKISKAWSTLITCRWMNDLDWIKSALYICRHTTDDQGWRLTPKPLVPQISRLENASIDAIAFVVHFSFARFKCRCNCQYRSWGRDQHQRSPTAFQLIFIGTVIIVQSFTVAFVIFRVQLSGAKLPVIVCVGVHLLADFNVKNVIIIVFFIVLALILIVGRLLTDQICGRNDFSMMVHFLRPYFDFQRSRPTVRQHCSLQVKWPLTFRLCNIILPFQLELIINLLNYLWIIVKSDTLRVIVSFFRLPHNAW